MKSPGDEFPVAGVLEYLKLEPVDSWMQKVTDAEYQNNENQRSGDTDHDNDFALLVCLPEETATVDVDSPLTPSHLPMP